MSNVAPLTARFTALAIDTAIIITYVFVLFGASLAFYYIAFGEVPAILSDFGPFSAHLLGLVTLTLPVGLYFYLCETSKKHATVGKQRMGIKVTSKNRKALTKKRILIRTTIKLLPWEFAHAFIYQVIYYSYNGGETPLWVIAGLYTANIIPFIYLAAIIFRKDHAGPHDIIANTLVVKS